MSDDAAVWKLAFGGLVLAFCGVTVALRKPPPEPAPAAVPAAIAAPAVSATEPSPEPAPPAPLDVQEDAPPVRIEILVPRPPAAKPLKQAAAARNVPPRVHRVVAARPASRHKADRPHYPYNPRDRWAWRETP